MKSLLLFGCVAGLLAAATVSGAPAPEAQPPPDLQPPPAAAPEAPPAPPGGDAAALPGRQAGEEQEEEAGLGDREGETEGLQAMEQDLQGVEEEEDTAALNATAFTAGHHHFVFVSHLGLFCMRGENRKLKHLGHPAPVNHQRHQDAAPSAGRASLQRGQQGPNQKGWGPPSSSQTKFLCRPPHFRTTDLYKHC